MFNRNRTDFSSISVNLGLEFQKTIIQATTILIPENMQSQDINQTAINHQLNSKHNRSKSIPESQIIAIKQQYAKIISKYTQRILQKLKV